MHVLKPRDANVKTEGEHRNTRSWTTIRKRVEIAVRDVCAKCNNGWMSKLEVKAKAFLLPMMLGEEVTLSVYAQNIISEWVVKTAMVFEYTGASGHHIYFTADERKQFATSRKIPTGVSVFLACYAGQVGFSAKEQHLIFEDGSATHPGYTCTDQFGCFVSQVFAHRLNTSPQLFKVDASFDNAEYQIAPAGGQVLWPPPEVFEDQSLELYRGRWLVL